MHTQIILLGAEIMCDMGKELEHMDLKFLKSIFLKYILRENMIYS